MQSEIQNQSNILSPSEIAQAIVQACKLDELSGSACLSCSSRVLLETSKGGVTLYCKQLLRDLEISVNRCTAWQLG